MPPRSRDGCCKNNSIRFPCMRDAQSQTRRTMWKSSAAFCFQPFFRTRAIRRRRRIKVLHFVPAHGTGFLHKFRKKWSGAPGNIVHAYPNYRIAHARFWRPGLNVTTRCVLLPACWNNLVWPFPLYRPCACAYVVGIPPMR